MPTQDDFILRFEKAERLLEQEKIIQALGIFLGLAKDRLRQLEIKTDEVFSNHDAILIERTADLSILTGQAEGAYLLLDALAKYYFGAGNDFAGIYTIIKIANLQLGEGKSCVAFDTLQELEQWTGGLASLDLSPAGLQRWERTFPGRKLFQKKREEALLFSRLQFLMGAILTSLGQYNQAIACLTRSIYHAGTFKEDVAVRSMLRPAKTALARAFLQKGDLKNARLQLEAIENDRAIDKVRSIHLLEAKGKLAMLQGRYGDAVAAFTTVAKNCYELNLPQSQAVALCNLAEIKTLVNQSFEAEELLDEAERIAERCGLTNLLPNVKVQQHLAVTRSTSPLASLNLFFPKKSSGALAAQALVAEEAWKNLSETPIEDDFLLAFEQRSLAVQLWLGEGDAARARQVLDETRLIFENTDSEIILHRLTALAFMAGYYEGADMGEFWDKTLAAIQFFEGQQMLPELWQLQRMVLWTGILPEPEAQRLAAENQRLLDTLTQSLPPESQAMFLLNKWSADEEYLASRLIVLERMKQRASQSIFTGWWHRIKMRQELNELLHHIDRYKDALARKQLSNKADPQKVQERKLPSIWRRLWLHPRGRAVITYLSLPDRLLVAVNAAGFFDYEVLPVTRLRLREVVRRCYLAFAGGGSYTQKRGAGFSEETETVDAEEALAEAARLLELSSLLNRLPSSLRRLTIVPDDMLHAFPFAALRVNGQYLGATHAISYAYENDIVFSKPQPLASQKKSALTVGIANGGSHFTPLPGAKQEVLETARFFQENGADVKVLLDEQCTKEAIFQHLPEARFLHVAAHGQYNREHPEKTGIILCNGEILSVRDIFDTMAFKGVGHAAITSCWAADHFVLPGRWVISLPETIWRNGCSGILGSLWKVSDAFATVFLKAYYEHLRQHPPDIALQLARRKAIENQLADARQPVHPSLWAGFNFYGNTHSVRLF